MSKIYTAQEKLPFNVYLKVKTYPVENQRIDEPYFIFKIHNFSTYELKAKHPHIRSYNTTMYELITKNKIEKEIKNFDVFVFGDDWVFQELSKQQQLIYRLMYG